MGTTNPRDRQGRRYSIIIIIITLIWKNWLTKRNRTAVERYTCTNVRPNTYMALKSSTSKRFVESRSEVALKELSVLVSLARRIFIGLCYFHVLPFKLVVSMN